MTYRAYGRCPNAQVRNMPSLTGRRPHREYIPGLYERKGPRSRFTEHDVATVVVLRALEISCITIANAIGCSEATVRQWIAGTTRGAARRRMG